MQSSSSSPLPAAAAAGAPPAPWRELFLQHAPPTFTVSTLHPTQPSSLPSSSSTSQLAAAPRARTCAFRGLWCDLPDNERNPAERNPPTYASDLPVFTTDARMAKVWELHESGSGSGDGDTGGGGPVEAVWWASGAQTQWRMRGTAWVLGRDVEGPRGAKAREAIAARIRARGGGGADSGVADAEAEMEASSWSWARELTAHFGNLSPAMRGTFRNPAPGTPRAIPGKEGEGLGQKVEDLHDALARANFRVVVIVPAEVDQVDLSNPEDPRRWLYTYVGPLSAPLHAGGEILGEWERCEVWP